MTFDHQRYWTERHKRQGQTYVARGGRRSEYEREFRAVAPFLQVAVAGAKDVLDFGCGTQRFRVPLESGGARYVGVDQVPGLGTQSLETPIPGASFDAIAANFVLQHVVADEDVLAILEKFQRWLRPGGRLILVNHDGLVAKPDAHMASRTMESLIAIAARVGFNGPCCLGRYDNVHWMGWLTAPGTAVTWPETPPMPVAPSPEATDAQYAEQFQVPPARSRAMNVTAQVEQARWALVLGGASCVWKDIDDFVGPGGSWPGYVIAVNDVGCHIPTRVDHWVSLHPEKMPKWVAARRELVLDEVTTWSRTRHTTRLLRPWGGGSSGLYGIQVALEALKCTRIILCGIPMTKTPHFPESKVHLATRVWGNASGHFKEWKKHLKKFGAVTRSMSGVTRDLLGSPTPEWLMEG